MRSEDARGELQQRRLAGAVWTGERDQFPLADAQSQIAKRVRAGVRIRGATQFEHQRALRNSDRKNGTPRMAVNAPIGSSVEVTAVRDTTSAKTTSAAPPRAVRGRRKRKSRCQIRRIR